MQFKKADPTSRFLSDFAKSFPSTLTRPELNPPSYPCVGRMGEDFEEMPCPDRARTAFSCQQCSGCATADTDRMVAHETEAAMYRADQS